MESAAIACRSCIFRRNDKYRVRSCARDRDGQDTSFSQTLAAGSESCHWPVCIECEFGRNHHRHHIGIEVDRILQLRILPTFKSGFRPAPEAFTYSRGRLLRQRGWHTFTRLVYRRTGWSLRHGHSLSRERWQHFQFRQEFLLVVCSRFQCLCIWLVVDFCFNLN